MDENVTLLERFASRITFIPKWLSKGINYSLIAYPIISNWYSLIMYRAAFRSEPKIMLRKKMTLPFFFPLLTNNFGYEKPMLEKNQINFSYKGRKLKMFYDTDHQMMNTLELIKDQFMGEEYCMLDIKGKDVVDIGANVGDTAMYFSLNGALHVYSFEPYPYSCKLARKNIAQNRLGKKVTVLNECCGGKKGQVKIDSKFQNDERSPLIRSSKGVSIPMVTLSDIVDRYKLDGAVLKVDCEGDEYDLILNAPDETLRRFDQILIEYHYGFRNLERKLLGAGFYVRHDLAAYGKNPTLGRPAMYYGLVLACRAK